MHTISHTITRDGEDIDLDVEYDVAPLIPGCTYGLPEHCYPDEGGEITEMTVTRDGEAFALTEAEDKALTERIYSVHDYDSDFSDYDDYRDCEYA